MQWNNDTTTNTATTSTTTTNNNEYMYSVYKIDKSVCTYSSLLRTVMEIVVSDGSRDNGPAVALLQAARMKRPVTGGAVGGGRYCP